MPKVFLDTNILVYSFDEADKRKRDVCRGILRSAREKGEGVISTRILQESARCAMVCSEDMNSGQKIRGIRIQSPFAP